jgi:outer membrane protein
MKKILIILFSGVISTMAQTEMSVEDVIKLGLRNNYDIRIARNNAEIAANNRALGTAGFLPTLDAGGGYQIARSEQETNSPFSFGNSDNENLSGQIQLNWTLFDGFRMFTERKRFNQVADLGQYQARNVIENTVVSILRAYFNLVQQEQLLDVAANTLAISESRLSKEKVRNELGGASSTDLLNARVSFNNDRAAFLTQQLNVEIARKDLNIILGREPTEPIAVAKNILLISLEMTYEDILNLALERNSAIVIARQNLSIARQNQHLTRSPLMPRLALNSSYVYGDRTVDSESRGEINTKSTDWAAGLTLSWNLFNGFRNRVDIQNSKIELTNRELALRNEENRLAGLVREKYDNYLKRMELVALEEENVIAAEQNLQLQQDRYQIGTSSSLEFRDAQVNLARAGNALIVARYQARISRLEIDQLIGNIVIE